MLAENVVPAFYSGLSNKVDLGCDVTAHES